MARKGERREECRMPRRSCRRRGTWSIAIGCLLAVALVVQGEEVSRAGRVNPPVTQVTVPLSELAVSDATVTVAVAQDPLQPFRAVLGMCKEGAFDGDQQPAEDAADLRSICETVDQVVRGLERPPQELNVGSYLVRIPLLQAREGLRAVTWQTKTLDDAIAFVDLLQNNKLKAVNVSVRDPWATEGSSRCSECPIKELVFDAKGLKEHGGLLRSPGRP